MSIQWRDEMSIDEGVIDHDHQILIEIINEFCAAKVDHEELPRLERILIKLERYASTHFNREEGLQRVVQYAYLDAHHHEHADLIRRLANIRSELGALHAGLERQSPEAAQVPTGAPATEAARAHAEVAQFLHHWLVDHIIQSDLRMKPYVARMAKHARRLPPLATSVAWV